MRKTVIPLCGFILLIGSSLPLAAGRVTTTPASVTFTDRTIASSGIQDRITSDGLGTYDPTGGVTCVIFSSTGDAHLDTSSSRNPLRVFEYDLSQVITGSGPTGSILSTGSVNVGALASMRVGDSKLTTAAFTTSIGQLHFLANEGGSYVTAVRLDDHTWTITTDDLYGLGAGDVAVLVQLVKNKAVKTGTYHLPFQLTVTCPTCVAPL